MLLNVLIWYRAPAKHQRPLENTSLEVVNQHITAEKEREQKLQCHTINIPGENMTTPRVWHLCYSNMTALSHLMSLSLMTSITGQGTFLRSRYTRSSSGSSQPTLHSTWESRKVRTSPRLEKSKHPAAVKQTRHTSDLIVQPLEDVTKSSLKSSFYAWK